MTRPSSISHATLAALESDQGDAFYLVDPAAFERNYQALLAGFQRHYPATAIGYSYKTNYLPRYCRLVDQRGGYAEVVSRLEYDLARRLGVVPARILFNGPYKRPEDIALAVREGAIINLDSPHQLGSLEAILDAGGAAAAAAGRAVVGVRVTFAHPGAEPSRFGFDADGDEAAAVVSRLRARGDVEVAGLHCHFLTRARSTDDYLVIARRMIELSGALLGPDAPPRFIDIGGGFFSPMSDDLKRQFPVPVPSYDEYGAAIGAAFRTAFGPSGGPELIIEPGLSITADTVRFAAKVLDVRRLGDRLLALVAGSMYTIKPTLSRRNLPLEVVAQPDRAGALEGGFDVVGYTCMEHDVLHTGYQGAIAPGDYAVFSNVGAYTNVLKPPFIRACPPMITWNADTGQAGPLLKRGETLDDIFATYALD